MAINLQYEPAAQTLGTVAYQAGAGQYRERQGERADANEKFMLQTMLQERARQQNMQQDDRRQQLAMQMQGQQQAFQQAMQGQQFQQQAALRSSFAMQDPETQSAILRATPDAQAEWNKLLAEEGQLQQAITEGRIRPHQQQQAIAEFQQKKIAFNPSRYTTQWKPGQGPGEVWTETVDVPGLGPTPMRYTRNRNGVPEPTYEGQQAVQSAFKMKEIDATNNVKMELGQAKVQADWELGSAKEMAAQQRSWADFEAKQQMARAQEEFKRQFEVEKEAAKTRIITPETRLQAYETATKLFTTTDPINGPSVDTAKVEAFVNKVLSGNQPQQAPALPAAPQQPSGPTVKPPPISLSNTPQSRELYASWPSGTEYIAPDGTRRRKP